MDTQTNYLQNTVFEGDIVYNKNNEDPAHFILRLKSLKKALSNDDRAESSNHTIPPPDDSVNTEFSLNNTTAAKPANAREAELRQMALNYYRMANKGVNITEGTNLSVGEYIYEKTGWYYDDFGNFVVDHEAPVYLGRSKASDRVMEYAGRVEAQSNAVRSEYIVNKAKENTEPTTDNTISNDDTRTRISSVFNTSIPQNPDSVKSEHSLTAKTKNRHKQGNTRKKCVSQTSVPVDISIPHPPNSVKGKQGLCHYQTS